MKSTCFVNVARYSLLKQFVRSNSRVVPHLKSVKWSNNLLDAIGKKYDMNESVLCFDRPASGILVEASLNTSLKHVIVWVKPKKNNKRIKELKCEFPETLSVNYSRFREETKKAVIGLRGQGIKQFLILNHNFNLTYTTFQALTQFFQEDEMWKVAPVDTYIFATENMCRLLTRPELRNHKQYFVGLTLCDLFFKHQILLEIPAEAFTCRVKSCKENAKSLSLLGLSLRDEFLNISKEEKSRLNSLIRLVKHLSSKKRSRTVPYLEHHCDGIGPDLIKEGIGMMDEIKDIRTFEWHRILKAITSHPNYQDSLMREILGGDPSGEDQFFH